MRIPEIRDKLDTAAADILRMAAALARWGHVIEELRGELHRRPAVRRAPPSRGEAPDPQAIQEFAYFNPERSYMEIAREFRCSIGRVSEALAGKRA